MNKFIFILLALFIFSCTRKPYVEHKLKFEKVADDCKEKQAYFRMVSNFGGERYEFEKCLPAEFSDNELTSWRSNDTVYVAFKAATASPGDKVFHLTLDIDSYPAYHFVSIDNDVYAISSTEKQ
jgi:hypothetical protein